MDYTVDVSEIKAAMARKGYNIGKLSKIMGVSRGTLSAFLRGKNPTYPFMCKVIAALEIEPDQANTIFFAQYLRNT